MQLAKHFFVFAAFGQSPLFPVFGNFQEFGVGLFPSLRDLIQAVSGLLLKIGERLVEAFHKIVVGQIIRCQTLAKRRDLRHRLVQHVQRFFERRQLLAAGFDDGFFPRQ